MKFAILLLVACLSVSLVVADDREEEVVSVQEQELTARKLLDTKYVFCDPYDNVITCKGKYEFCGLLKHPVCKDVKTCKKVKVCVKYGYRYYKKKYCKKYGYKYVCDTKKVCKKYACMKKKRYGYHHG
ncbi:unnamed protein product [Ostreobium quekettii]|uniref:Uncharacterized protein n=1 Tax=Ostreobium quekettii TaxID=121088 RepID=A0A8S1IS23_9CHLO|nr:unnamed protein product [Ostreobium quekettii]|eukprot:evm.model.scf_176EXC.2 EVM.evm.TU.scf_176EXC.2   scf_176EXC:20109-22434(+)